MTGRFVALILYVICVLKCSALVIIMVAISPSIRIKLEANDVCARAAKQLNENVIKGT